MCGIERLTRPAFIGRPGVPHREELAQCECFVLRRLDVDYVLVGGVHMHPVEASRRRLAALDADAARKRGEIALVDDLEHSVVVGLRVLELIARDPSRRPDFPLDPRWGAFVRVDGAMPW